MNSINSFDSFDEIEIFKKKYEIYRIGKIANSQNLPYCLKILLENLLRNEDGKNQIHLLLNATILDYNI